MEDKLVDYEFSDTSSDETELESKFHKTFHDPIISGMEGGEGSLFPTTQGTLPLDSFLVDSGVPGNWPCHISLQLSLPLELFEHIEEITSQIIKIKSTGCTPCDDPLNSINNHLNSPTPFISTTSLSPTTLPSIHSHSSPSSFRASQLPLHLSLSRTLYLKPYQMPMVLKSLQTLLKSVAPFQIGFLKWNCYSQENGERSYLSLDVGAGSNTIKKLTRDVDEIITSFRQPKYYESAQFHVSVGSCPGNSMGLTRKTMMEWNSNENLSLFSKSRLWISKLSYQIDGQETLLDLKGVSL